MSLSFKGRIVQPPKTGLKCISAAAPTLQQMVACQSCPLSIDQYMEVVLYEPIPQYWSLYGSCTVWAYPSVLISLWKLYCMSLSLSIDQFMEVVLCKPILQY